MEIEKILKLWQREMKKFFREKSRVITSVVSPLLWIVVFGSGMRGSGFGGGAANGEDYRVFIFPGILGMSLLFMSMFAGVSVIWERQFGILKAVLVAPISRTSFVIGKAAGGASCAVLQGLILLCFTPIVKVPLSIPVLLCLVPVMFMVSLGVVCIGLLIAAFMESMEGFNMIMSFAIMPMFFFSGAIYPLESAPGWLKVASHFDPLTYGVDALRTIMIGNAHQFMPLYVDLGVMMIFASVIITLATLAFGIKK